jgi:predicted deacetylase
MSANRNGSFLAVAIHDVVPATLPRCIEIRDWLADRGVERTTLLAVPAPSGRPIRPRSSDLASWLRARWLAGDAVAQHGFQHVQRDRAGIGRQWVARRQGGGAAEFVGLDERRTEEALDRGRMILNEAGINPRGFVAPGYAYTAALRRAVGRRYVWWAGLLTLHTATGPLRSAALCLGASTRLKRVSSPVLVRGLSLRRGDLMRVDVHPADFDHHRFRHTLERVLDRAAGRRPVSYDELVAA